MNLTSQFNLASKSSYELRGLLSTAFKAAVQADPGSKAQLEAQALIDAIKLELTVRDFTL
jgi:hypothetical protein